MKLKSLAVLATSSLLLTTVFTAVSNAVADDMSSMQSAPSTSGNSDASGMSMQPGNTMQQDNGLNQNSQAQPGINFSNTPNATETPNNNDSIGSLDSNMNSLSPPTANNDDTSGKPSLDTATGDDDY